MADPVLREKERARGRAKGLAAYRKDPVSAREKARVRNNKRYTTGAIQRYRENNPEVTRNANLRWRARNLEKARAKSRESLRLWREKNAERNRAQVRDWRKKNPDGHRLQTNRRRANKRSNTVTGQRLTRADWETICEDHTVNGKVRCAYCKKPCAPTIDHVVPLKRGGTDSKDNVVPACALCNSRKGAKLLSEWRCTT